MITTTAAAATTTTITNTIRKIAIRNKVPIFFLS